MAKRTREAGPASLLIGTAGWQLPPTVPRVEAAHALERYARHFNAVEINSTFHRIHRPATFSRWAELVPDHFRFAVKMNKAITHEHRLTQVGSAQLFLEGITGLGRKLGVVLVQLPPSLVWSAETEHFFQALRDAYTGALVVEARHPSWNAPDVLKMLRDLRIGGVAADPVLLFDRLAPYGDLHHVYYRLHGSPRTYWSAYSQERLSALVDPLRDHALKARTVWVMFDNTAAGAAAPNAMHLLDLLRKRK